MSASRCYYLMLLGLGFLCTDAYSQKNETKYFIDVTATHIPIDADAHTLDVVLADIDKDGDLDAVLALEMAPNRLYLNDGTGKFTWKKGVFAERSHDTEHVRVGDFDKDGNLDVIFIAEDDKSHEFYLGNGDGTFKEATDRLPKKSEGNGLDIGDVNGDGLLDIVIGNTGDGARTFLWLNNPEKPGYFIDYTEKGMPNTPSQTQGVKLADMNSDGYLDLIEGNQASPNRLLFNDGKGHFTDQPSRLKLTTPVYTRMALVLDANGDKHPDILFTNLSSHSFAKEPRDTRARLLINDGKGNFIDETATRMPEQKFPSYAGEIFDFNHDGHPDIILTALADGFKPKQLQALQNDGKGYFKLVTSEVIPETTVGRCWGIAVGDVNNDGKPDLFVGQWGSQARLLLGR